MMKNEKVKEELLPQGKQDILDKIEGIKVKKYDNPWLKQNLIDGWLDKLENPSKYKVDSYIDNFERLKEYNDNPLCKTMGEALRDLRNQLDYDVEDGQERALHLSDIVDDEWLQEYKETYSYFQKHARKRKKDRLSESDYVSRNLEYLSDYLIEKSDDFEFPVISKYMKEQNVEREMLINYTDADYESETGIAEEVLDYLAQEENQSEFHVKRLSEDLKRKNRQISNEDMIKYPELLEMHNGMVKLSVLIGKHDSFEDDEKMAKKELFISKITDWLQFEKEKSFGNWISGKPRINLESILEKPFGMEEILVNTFTGGIVFVDGKVSELTMKKLNEKYNEVLKFYGVSPSAYGNYYKINAMINQIGYEMSIVKDQLRKPIEIKGTRQTTHMQNQVDTKGKLIQEHFDMSNKEHVYSLLSFQTGRVNKNLTYFPLYSMLQDKHESNVGSVVYHLLQEFDEMVRLADLTSLERDVIAVVKQERGLGIDEAHPYKRAVEYINEVHKQNKVVKDITYMLKNTVTNKIVEAYLDYISICEIVKCTQCQKSKKLTECNFGNDGRKKSGFRSICRVCDRENQEKYLQ